MGWYLSYGKNLLVRSGSDVTGAVYRRVLEDHLVPHGRTWYRNNWLLADDNASTHRDCVVDAYLHGPPWTRHHPHGLGPISFGYELNRTYLGRNWSWFGGIGPSVSEPEATGSCSPKFTATERDQTLVSSMPRRVRALVDPRGSSTQYWTVDTLGLT